MAIQRLAIVVTLLNVALMAFLVAELRPASAQTAPAVVRARALEIVDSEGRVRASISVEPPVSVDGRRYPETVLLRLTDPRKGPVVKLTASAEGSALHLSDDSEGGVQVSAKSAGSFVKVVGRDGREEVIRPSR